ncbi:hypothetical protein MJD09_03150, partial [bacterium]|nr:hypothetical protein [bacterium]
MLIWEASDWPTIYLNAEVFSKVESLRIIAAGRIETNQEIGSENIGGVDKIKLARRFWGKPYIFVCQG